MNHRLTRLSYLEAMTGEQLTDDQKTEVLEFFVSNYGTKRNPASFLKDGNHAYRVNQFMVEVPAPVEEIDESDERTTFVVRNGKRIMI